MKFLLFILLFALLPCQQSGSVGNDTLWPGGSGSGFSGDGSSDELSLTCAERNIVTSGETLGNYSVTAINVVRSFRIVYFTLFFVAAVSLNCLLVFLVIRNKKLRTLSFAIALQVVIIDIAIAVFLCIPAIITTAAGEWILGKEVCVLTGFLAFSLILVRTGLMFVFVIDRFLSVFFPYFYPKHKVKITVSLSVLTWLFCVVLCSLMLPGILDCYTFNNSINVCIASSTCSRGCSIFSIVAFNVVGLPSAVIPTILFGTLYCKARRLRKEMASLAPSQAIISGEDKALAKREMRATVTFFLLFVSLFAVTIPGTIITIVIAQVSNLVDLPDLFFIIQAIAGSAGSLYVLTDPIVLMRDRDVREVLSSLRVRLFRNCCSKESSTAEN